LRAAHGVSIGVSRHGTCGEQEGDRKNYGTADHKSAVPCREMHYFL
jgi:hypothetical protein